MTQLLTTERSSLLTESITLKLREINLKKNFLIFNEMFTGSQKLYPGARSCRDSIQLYALN